MRILVKFPTRERPHKFLAAFNAMVDHAACPALDMLVSIDDNDPLMQKESLQQQARHRANCVFISGDSKNKIDAVNRDMNHAPSKWDILVLLSDDMMCVRDEWDRIIIRDMYSEFPDTDGVLWYWDGDKNTRNNLNTMCIIGRKYYERFGYIYHPSYKSLWCDNEFTEVAKAQNKLFYSEEILFKHVHFSNTPGLQADSLMRHTQSFFYEDKANYERRKANNFDL